MSFLICRFASPRSRPEQIQDWIHYLDRLRAAHQHDQDRLQLIEHLEAQANGWLQQARRTSTDRPSAAPQLAGVAGD